MGNTKRYAQPSAGTLRAQHEPHSCGYKSHRKLITTNEAKPKQDAIAIAPNERIRCSTFR
jgi:hypothetical protein